MPVSGRDTTVIGSDERADAMGTIGEAADEPARKDPSAPARTQTLTRAVIQRGPVTVFFITSVFERYQRARYQFTGVVGSFSSGWPVNSGLSNTFQSADMAATAISRPAVCESALGSEIL